MNTETETETRIKQLENRINILREKGDSIVSRASRILEEELDGGSIGPYNFAIDYQPETDRLNTQAWLGDSRPSYCPEDAPQFPHDDISIDVFPEGCFNNTYISEYIEQFKDSGFYIREHNILEIQKDERFVDCKVYDNIYNQLLDIVENDDDNIPQFLLNLFDEYIAEVWLECESTRLLEHEIEEYEKEIKYLKQGVYEYETFIE